MRAGPLIGEQEHDPARGRKDASRCRFGNVAPATPAMDPNFFVEKGFKFFTMPWGPWAKAGIENALSGIKR